MSSSRNSALKGLKRSWAIYDVKSLHFDIVPGRVFVMVLSMVMGRSWMVSYCMHFDYNISLRLLTLMAFLLYYTIDQYLDCINYDF
jgi:hypothetical protein